MYLGSRDKTIDEKNAMNDAQPLKYARYKKEEDSSKTVKESKQLCQILSV